MCNPSGFRYSEDGGDRSLQSGRDMSRCLCDIPYVTDLPTIIRPMEGSIVTRPIESLGSANLKRSAAPFGLAS